VLTVIARQAATLRRLDEALALSLADQRRAAAQRQPFPADWCEHCGHLLPDRPLVTNVVPCRCCPDETLRRRIERARVRARDGVQLDLFDTAGAPR
jgi:hypothetical protein